MRRERVGWNILRQPHPHKAQSMRSGCCRSLSLSLSLFRFCFVQWRTTLTRTHTHEFQLQTRSRHNDIHAHDIHKQMLQEGYLRPAPVSAADVANCQMTRQELQKRLAECAFGRNQVIFDAYFRWSDGGNGQPYCNVCFRPIGVHGDGATAPQPSETAPLQPSQTLPPQPSQTQPPPADSMNQAQMFPGYPPPQLYANQQPSSYSQQPYAYVQQSSATPTYPPASSLYAPPSAAAIGIVMPSFSHHALPLKVVSGGNGNPDRVYESFSNIHLVFAGVFFVFFVSSLVAALGLVGNRDDEDASVTRSDPYVFISSGWWLLCACFYAYRCKKFECRISRGVSIESEERRLLTICTSSRSSIEWGAIVRGGVCVEVCSDPSAAFCCMAPQWVLIVLRPAQGFASSSSGNPVLLARCAPGLVDVESRAWATYIDSLRTQR